MSTPEGLFTYDNGAGPYHADPDRLYRSLVRELGPDPDALVEQIKSADRGASADATDRFLAIVRRVFQLPEVDPQTGQGVRDAEVLVIWNNYQDFLSKKKPSTGDSLTS